MRRVPSSVATPPDAEGRFVLPQHKSGLELSAQLKPGENRDERSNRRGALQHCRQTVLEIFLGGSHEETLLRIGRSASSW